jgi:general secretion pathway protein C
MDVAKRLADWRNQPPEQWFTSLNRYLPPGVTGLLVVVIAYQLATLTWALAPGSVPSAAPASVRGESVAAEPVDFTVLVNARLFGEAAERPTQAPAAAVIDAPDTTLSLSLKGILSKEGDTSGGAIISSNNGEDRAYRVGQTIDGADGSTLHSVYSDRVLLDRNGQLETLRLPKELAASSSAFTAMPPMPQPAPGPPGGGSLRETIAENASRITDIVRVAPHVQEGQVVGFRVNPGRDRASFEALGLRPGDVVTDINGTVLNDPSQGLQVFQSLGETTQANVTILRDGVPQTVVIDTSQLQSLQENRQ